MLPVWSVCDNQGTILGTTPYDKDNNSPLFMSSTRHVTTSCSAY